MNEGDGDTVLKFTLGLVILKERILYLRVFFHED